MSATLLCLDTANAVSLTCCADETGGVLAHHINAGQNKQAEIMMKALNSVLSDAKKTKSDITAVAFSEGPGGFTGLRVACGVAQGLAWGLNCPVVPVGTLAMYAQAARVAHALDAGAILAVLNDARMNEIYAESFKVTDTGVESCGDALLVKPDDVALWLEAQGAQMIVGTALTVYEPVKALTQTALSVTDDDLVNALAHLAAEAYRAGKTVTAAQAAPRYVRDRVALTREQRENGERL